LDGGVTVSKNKDIVKGKWHINSHLHGRKNATDRDFPLLRNGALKFVMWKTAGEYEIQTTVYNDKELIKFIKAGMKFMYSNNTTWYEILTI
jgi:hypothetical protein